MIIYLHGYYPLVQISIMLLITMLTLAVQILCIDKKTVVPYHLTEYRKSRILPDELIVFLHILFQRIF